MPKVDSTLRPGLRPDHRLARHAVGGRAIIDAAEKLKADLEAGLRWRLDGRVYAGETIIDDTTALGGPRSTIIKTHTSFGYATQMVVLDDAGARRPRGRRARRRPRAQPGSWSRPDRGRDPHGPGLCADRGIACEDGMPVTFKMKEIGALRARDMPHMDVTLVEEPEPEGPLGAKGIGEIGLVPTAAAVASALAAFRRHPPHDAADEGLARRARDERRFPARKDVIENIRADARPPETVQT